MTLVYIALGSNLASPLEQVQAAIPRPGRNSAQPRGRRLFVLPHAAAGPAGSAGLSQRRRCAGNRPAPRDAARSYSAHRTAAGASAQSRTLGPRTLDLDIMLFGDAVINSERLTVPHYDMKNRGFMLWPLFEIAPDLHFPDGPALRAVLDNLGAAKPASW